MPDQRRRDGFGGQAAAAVPHLPQLQNVRGGHPLQRLRGRRHALHGTYVGCARRTSERSRFDMQMEETSFNGLCPDFAEGRPSLRGGREELRHRGKVQKRWRQITSGDIHMTSALRKGAGSKADHSFDRLCECGRNKGVHKFQNCVDVMLE